MVMTMIVLGIETSCDETAAAVVRDDGTVLGETIFSQVIEHAPYVGVVPEIAARAHLDRLDDVILSAMGKAKVKFDQLSGIAATAGPGLIGGLVVGLMEAKAIAAVHKLPFMAINHLEGHALVARLTHKVEFPYLLLLISGGHCEILICEDVGSYRRLGATLDDALGEAFDKTAKMLGLGYPGGPAVEKAALQATPEAIKKFPLPRPLFGKSGCDFSFAGLKTAVRQAIEALPPGPVSDADQAGLCAAFQQTAFAVLADRLDHAIAMARTVTDLGPTPTVVVAGGVAANQALRHALEKLCADHQARLIVPPPALCTDNGVMIAWAGVERLRLGLIDTLDVAARPRWPLEELRQQGRAA